MVHHGVSVTYTLFGYPASRPRLLPSFSFLIRAVYARLRLTRSLDAARFVPAPSILAGQDVLRNANVCIPHARPSGPTIIDVRPFSFFVITSLFLIYNDKFGGFWYIYIYISITLDLSWRVPAICREITQPLNRSLPETTFLPPCKDRKDPKDREKQHDGR